MHLRRWPDLIWQEAPSPSTCCGRQLMPSSCPVLTLLKCVSALLVPATPPCWCLQVPSGPGDGRVCGAAVAQGAGQGAHPRRAGAAATREGAGGRNTAAVQALTQWLANPTPCQWAEGMRGWRILTNMTCPVVGVCHVPVPTTNSWSWKRNYRQSVSHVEAVHRLGNVPHCCVKARHNNTPTPNSWPLVTTGYA